MPGTNVYTVAQVNRYVAGLMQEDYFLRRLSVRGEVSNINKYDQSPSGHIYFQLKDADACISCCMWRSKRAQGLKFPLKNGDAVIVSGQLRVYEINGTYSLQADTIRREGVGELAARFEELKGSLAEMGMFDASYKKPIPRYAGRVGIVTAPGGAAIRDIIRTAHNKNPYVELILAPARVQGEGAAEEIAEAIARLDAVGCDVMIVGRGGGSIEDLWAFNEEIVARAIFACETPVISAVGHEVDTTIADLVADYRAATPTAGAEAAVWDYDEYMDMLSDYEALLTRQLSSRIDTHRRELSHLSRRLAAQSPEARLGRYRDRILTDERRLAARSPDILAGRRRSEAIELYRRLDAAIRIRIEDAGHRAVLYRERLEGASPARRFAGGYAYAVDKDGHKLMDAGVLSPGDEIGIYLKKGRLTAAVDTVYDDWERR